MLQRAFLEQGTKEGVDFLCLLMSIRGGPAWLQGAWAYASLLKTLLCLCRPETVTDGLL